jgi:hypothetical protein
MNNIQKNASILYNELPLVYSNIPPFIPYQPYQPYQPYPPYQPYQPYQPYPPYQPSLMYPRRIRIPIEYLQNKENKNTLNEKNVDDLIEEIKNELLKTSSKIKDDDTRQKTGILRKEDDCDDIRRENERLRKENETLRKNCAETFKKNTEGVQKLNKQMNQKLEDSEVQSKALMVELLNNVRASKKTNKKYLKKKIEESETLSELVKEYDLYFETKISKNKMK